MSSYTNATRFPRNLTRQLLVMIPALALFLGAAGTVNAQSEEEEAGLLEEVVVTGTRKEGRLPTETLSPVDLITGTALQYQGASDLTDSLTKLTPSLSTQRFPIADGTAFVRPVVLRNLAPDQTLVLVNGTRRHRSALVNLQLAPLGTVNQGSQAVDFSAFPASAIKRVEVLRDGASAQYGSDAIAGVINVILKDDREGATINAQYGEYTEGDGERINFNANAGFSLGEDGFLNLSFEYTDSKLTSRGQARPDAAAVADIVGAGLVPYNGLGQRWGDPEVEAYKFFLNTGITFGNGGEWYANASYMDNTTTGGFFYRGPVLDPIHMISARSTLMQDNNGDFLPDPAPQTLIDSIIGAGLNPADYVTADGSSPSGWVLLNPIYTEFPGGYSPLFGADIKDYEVVTGLRGDFNDNFTWDARFRIAENEITYVLQDSINPSLGRLSPTVFNPGTLTQQETGVNVDFVKTFDNSPLNVAFGVEWRNETYKVGAGDLASTETGPTFAQFGVGSDGFQGFTTDQAGKWEKDSTAAYVDIETDFTDKFSAAVAARYENHDGFSSTFDWKISGRFAFNDAFAVRATANTGFRVPTPGQINTLNLTTSADSAGNLIPSGFYPVSHPVAVALGAVPQQTEESTSFTIGLVWTAADNVSVTLDYYDISIDDRIGALNKTVDQAAVDKLNAAGFPNADLLLGSAASYFSNAFDSDITGIDLTIDSYFDLAGGTLNVGFRHNYNDQKVNNIKPGTINASRAYDLENQVPNNRSVLNFDYVKNRWGGLVRFNYYGGWSTTGGIFSPGDASDASDYGSEILVDVEARFQINKTFSIALGGDNVLDNYPDHEQDGVFQFLGVVHSITSPFGFNGAFWYIRGTASF
ncbi:MAG: TonB-dependent receptor [Gammaproteobacteria bacterium]|nr:MAG: TonB-dependent receptor [Gammaproteobacteria bacterium]